MEGGNRYRRQSRDRCRDCRGPGQRGLSRLTRGEALCGPARPGALDVSDVSKPADVAALVIGMAELGPLTLLANNAGVQVENDWREYRRRLGFGRRYQLSRRVQHVPRRCCNGRNTADRL